MRTGPSSWLSPGEKGARTRMRAANRRARPRSDGLQGFTGSFPATTVCSNQISAFRVDSILGLSVMARSIYAFERKRKAESRVGPPRQAPLAHPGQALTTPVRAGPAGSHLHAERSASRRGRPHSRGGRTPRWPHLARHPHRRRALLRDTHPVLPQIAR